MLLSFAQFEHEVTGERIRDKIAASKKKGIWMGGVVPLGYRVEGAPAAGNRDDRSGRSAPVMERPARGARRLTGSA